MNHLGVIHEAAYLSTGNTPQYRRIMRIFFREYEKKRFQLYKEAILDRKKAGYQEQLLEWLERDMRTHRSRGADEKERICERTLFIPAAQNPSEIL